MKIATQTQVVVGPVKWKKGPNRDRSLTFWVGTRRYGKQRFIIGPNSTFARIAAPRVLIRFVPGDNPKILEVIPNPSIRTVRLYMEGAGV